ncbi:MAG: hypothetical protein FLDDKLPJ_02009 [Phycisphaerae bacterium]|nr:hypothetical protein [Phycisphaerae bacterium]
MVSLQNVAGASGREGRRRTASRRGGMAAAGGAAMLVLAVPVDASFHFMQIEQIVAGVDGNLRAQAIQLRMRENGQEHVHDTRLIVRDAEGANPIVLIEFPSDVAGASAGDRILIVSADFVNHSTPPVEPDFVLTSLIPEAYLAAGSLTFENPTGTLVVWRFSWGGDGYSGATAGAQTNDDDGDFGVWPAPLPTDGITALMFSGDAADVSSTNAEDYEQRETTILLTRNDGDMFEVTSLDCVNDPDNDADGDFVCGDVDNCPDVPNADQVDTDGDGLGDACDACPLDAEKQTPGDCGCGQPDEDSDGDGVLDCDDNCVNAGNADQSDSDGDGFGDACDECPTDPEKSVPDECGCEGAEVDADGDGVPDCVDNCPGAGNALQIDSDGDGAGDACDECPFNPDRVEAGEGGDCASAPDPDNGNDNEGDVDNDNVNDNDDDDDNDNLSPPSNGNASGGSSGRRNFGCGVGMTPLIPVVVAGLTSWRRGARGLIRRPRCRRDRRSSQSG